MQNASRHRLGFVNSMYRTNILCLDTCALAFYSSVVFIAKYGLQMRLIKLVECEMVIFCNMDYYSLGTLKRLFQVTLSSNNCEISDCCISSELNVMYADGMVILV